MAKRRQTTNENGTVRSADVADDPVPDEPAQEPIAADDPVPDERPQAAPVRTIVVRVPIAPDPIGPAYVSRRVDIRLDRECAETIERLFRGLDACGERMANGRRVAQRQDAVRWLLESITREERIERE